MTSPSRLAAACVAVGLSLLPQLAWACPVCAQRSDGGSMRTLALGAFVVMPWIVAATVGLYVRRLSKETSS
jgi:hypothetical protein